MSWITKIVKREVSLDIENGETVFTYIINDNIFVPNDKASPYYQLILAWLEIEGNELIEEEL